MHLERASRVRSDERRGSATERGYDWKWRGYAKRYLAAHPLCLYCELQGRTTASQCVDHRIPISRGGEMWNPANHAPACLTCNTQKRDRTYDEHIATIPRA